MPLVTVGQAPVFALNGEALNRIGHPTFDLHRFVVLPEAARAEHTATNGTTALVRSQRITPHRVEAEVQADGPTWMVISQAFHPAWRATVNGRRARVWRANHAFQAVALPAGASSVRLIYADRMFRVGACVSLVAAAGCVVLGRRRRAPAVAVSLTGGSSADRVG